MDQESQDDKTQCSECLNRCKGFLTDREQRKVWGMGVLYLSAFPLLVLMIVVGAIKAAPPGEDNPNCPAEPNMPWFLITGGSTLSVFLLFRIAINKLTRYIKNRQDCCDQVRYQIISLMRYNTITITEPFLFAGHRLFLRVWL